MKFSSLLLAGALLVSTAVPALAYGGYHRSRGGVEIENEANILNISVAGSNTGMNRQTRRGDMTTGYAISDSWSTVNHVNETTLPRVSRESKLEIENDANILNASVAISNTGLNYQRAGRHSDMRTGNAESTSTADVLNVNVTGF